MVFLSNVILYHLKWENHAKSLQLEEQTLDNIKKRIEEKVMNNSGTWIDWQYLLDAAFLLKKVCFDMGLLFFFNRLVCLELIIELLWLN